MSKERAKRRAVREHEAALRAAARAADAERRERREARRTARRRAVRRVTTGRLPGSRPVGRDTGTLARRRRAQRGVLVVLLVALNVLVWYVRADWEARLAALVVSILVFPVLQVLVLPSRR